MSKDTYNINPILEPLIKPMNPEAVNYINWLNTDINSLSNWIRQLFCNDVDLNNPKTIELVKASEICLNEIESDITKIKEFLDNYINNNN